MCPESQHILKGLYKINISGLIKHLSTHTLLLATAQIDPQFLSNSHWGPESPHQHCRGSDLPCHWSLSSAPPALCSWLPSLPLSSRPSSVSSAHWGHSKARITVRPSIRPHFTFTINCALLAVQSTALYWQCRCHVRWFRVPLQFHASPAQISQDDDKRVVVFSTNRKSHQPFVTTPAISLKLCGHGS